MKRHVKFFSVFACLMALTAILFAYTAYTPAQAAEPTAGGQGTGPYYKPGTEVAYADFGGDTWHMGGEWQESRTVSLPQAGEYMLVITYRPTNESVQPMELILTVDGHSHLILLDQSYEYDRFPFAQDERGDELRPKLIKDMGWLSMPAYMADGSSSTPAIFPLGEGESSIVLENIGASVAIQGVSVVSTVLLPTYDEYIRLHPDFLPQNTVITVEAENIAGMSSRTIQINSLSEAGLSPETYGRRVYNSIGGVNWQLANQWIEWTVNAPQDGFYNIAFKYRQNFNAALFSYRKVEINGDVPFAELLNVPFGYNSGWTNKILGDSSPYKIYLNQGENTIRLTNVNEMYIEVYEDLLQIADEIRELDVYVRGITGVLNDHQVDTFRIFHLDRYIPNLIPTLEHLADSIYRQMEIIGRITGNSPERYDMLRHEVRNLRRFAEDIELLTNSFDALLRSQTNVASFAVSLMEQPLILDTVMVVSPDERFPRANPGFFRTLFFTIRQLIASFTDDRGSVARESDEVLEVWMQRGRDYINLMQQHANEYFTPLTGIRVNVNYIPGADVLVLANAANQQPEVVSGINRDVPFNFALRNAIMPLDGYPGFDSIIENIPPGAMVPYHFAGENYAIPEELLFNVLFYRRDIFDDFNLATPSTWEDAKLLVPTLQQENMNFWLAWGDWLTFYYQFEMEPYTQDGLNIALDNEEGFQVFKYWSELYTKYNFPHRIGSFYQNFRMGHLPVGVSTLQDYFFIRLAAPELAGLWGIAPVPGILNEDGVNIRWQSGDQRGVILFRTDEEREEKGWEFIRWWMDTETQERFALDLEFSLGQEFRWFSSNRLVVESIPWDENDRRTIMTQMQWFKGIPFAPGGSYMLEREMRNALSDVVLDQKNFRDSLEKAVRLTRQEMARTQRNFNIIDVDGKVLRRLSMLRVPLPEIAVPEPPLVLALPTG